MNIQSAWIDLAIGDGATMRAFSAVPVGNTRSLPGLILFQEAFGVNPHIRRVAERFAAEGYVVIAPELFHRTAPAGFTCPYTDFSVVEPHLSAVSEPGLRQDTEACWNWLQQHPRIQRNHLACIGYCLGGRAAFVANASFPFRAAISYYGGRIAPELVHLTPSLHGPMLFFWAGRDKNITPDKVAAVEESLRRAKKSYINVVVSDADHGFFCEDRSVYNPQAANEAWALTLAFLKGSVEV